MQKVHLYSELSIFIFDVDLGHWQRIYVSDKEYPEAIEHLHYRRAAY